MKNRTKILILAIVFVVFAVVSMGIGRYPISPIRVLKTLFGGGNAQESAVVIKIRLPRIIAATLIAAGWFHRCFLREPVL